MSRERIPVAALGVLAVALVLGAWPGSGRGDRTVRVDLDNAAGLVPRDEVRVAGVVVGEVRRLRVTPDTHVVAELRLDHALPLGRDARADIRAANLFGGKYLDLQPGTSSRPAPSGWAIPRAQTAAPVEVDDVLDTLDPDTRGRLATLLNETGIGLAGRGRDVHALLGDVPPTLRQATRLLADLGGDNRTLGRLVAQTDRVVGAFAGQRRQIGEFVAVARDAASGFAREQTKLRATVREAPGTVAQLHRTLTQLDALAVPLGPAADALRTTAAPLDHTLAQIAPVEQAARPALAAAAWAGAPLTALGHVSSKVLKRTAPTLAAASRFATDLAPVSTLLAGEGQPLIGVLQGWARATQLSDGLGHYFRGEYVLNADDLLRVITDNPALAPPAKAKATATPAAGDTVPAPSAAPAPAKPAPAGHALQLPGLPPIKLPALPDLRSTGKDQPAAPSVSGLLDFLLKP